MYKIRHIYTRRLLAVGYTCRQAVENAARNNISLSRANLRGCFLQGSDLTGIDLSKADLTGADLSDCNFTRADLRANLSYALLRDSVFTDARIDLHCCEVAVELLRREAGNNQARRGLVGEIAAFRYNRWYDYYYSKHPEYKWMLECLAKYVGGEKFPPAPLFFYLQGK